MNFFSVINSTLETRILNLTFEMQRAFIELGPSDGIYDKILKNFIQITDAQAGSIFDLSYDTDEIKIKQSLAHYGEKIIFNNFEFKKWMLSLSSNKKPHLFHDHFTHTDTVDDYFIIPLTDHHHIQGIMVLKGTENSFHEQLADLLAPMIEATNNIVLINYQKLAKKEVHEFEEQALRHRDMSIVSGGMAHDFNNIFSTISNSLGYLQVSTEGHHDRQMIDYGLKAAERGHKLIESLLSYSCLLPQNLKTKDIIALTKNICHSHKNNVISAALSIDLPECEALVEIDKDLYRKALSQLLNNAVDAIDNETGNIKVSMVVADHESFDQLLPEHLPYQNYVVLIVEDNGCGMTSDVQKSAIHPFFTTKDMTQNSGLGLSMVYGFAKQMMGHLTLDSKLGQGTTVRLYIPLID